MVKSLSFLDEGSDSGRELGAGAREVALAAQETHADVLFAVDRWHYLLGEVERIVRALLVGPCKNLRNMIYYQER